MNWNFVPHASLRVLAVTVIGSALMLACAAFGFADVFAYVGFGLTMLGLVLMIVENVRRWR